MFQATLPADLEMQYPWIAAVAPKHPSWKLSPGNGLGKLLADLIQGYQVLLASNTSDRGNPFRFQSHIF